MRAENSPMKAKSASAPVLCVDLDGTLLATDMLWESVLRLVKQRLHLLFALPFWLVRGRAHLKHRLAAHVSVDPTTLPFREDVVSFLAKEQKSGRKIVLVTAWDRQLVEPIVQHLGLFHDVIATDGIVNLAGAKKREALENRFGYHQFDYIGNTAADLSVCDSANASLLVESSRKTLTRAKRLASVQHIFHGKANRWAALVKALRYSQWSKNLLIFVPLLTSHKVFETALILNALTAFVAMSFCASSIYIINDFFDVEADRQHPKKKLRPFAAGTVSIPAGAAMAATMCLGGFVLGWLILPLQFIWLLLAYLALTISYSVLLKRKLVADVITLALLYTLRILIGGAAVDVHISPWLLAFSVFLFLSLAFVKRYGEIDTLGKSPDEEMPGRAYIAADKEWMRSMGSTSGYLSVLVFALYINGREVTILYQQPEMLWFACPALLYWVTRFWLLAARGKVDDDPLVFALKDRVSYAVAIAVLLSAVVAL
jgi:4-hydroxybenzoate polyprenyltransferase/phosphoserine phosphatase